MKNSFLGYIFYVAVLLSLTACGLFSTPTPDLQATQVSLLATEVASNQDAIDALEATVAYQNTMAAKASNTPVNPTQTNPAVPPTITLTPTPLPPSDTPTATKVPPSLTPTQTRVPPTRTSTPTITVNRNKLVFYGSYGISGTDSYTINDLHMSKFQALAFTKGIEVSTYQDRDDFIAALQQPEVAVVIYADIRGSSEAFAAIKSFVDDGGRAFLYYSEGWIDDNSLLQTLFNITVVEEEIRRSSDSLILDPGLNPPDLQAYQVGFVDDNHIFTVDAYLVALNEGLEQGVITSIDTGRERLVYYSTGDVIFLPYIASTLDDPYLYVYFRPFFDNEFFDYFENEQAADALLDFLMEGYK